MLNVLKNRFITLFLGRLNPSIHRVEYSSAGQSPILIHHSQTNDVERLDVTGIALASMAFPIVVKSSMQKQVK